MDVLDILKGRAAEWYRLTFIPDGCQFALDVREDVAELLGRDLLRESFEMTGYLAFMVPPGHPGWGIGRRFLPAVSKRKGWVRWAGTLPKAAIKSDEGWEALYEISLSLGTALSALTYRCSEQLSVGTPQQAMYIPGLGCRRDIPYGGSSFGARFFPAFHEWLITQDLESLARELSRNMALADSRMAGRKVEPSGGFIGVGANFDGMFLHLRGGGNCACMSVDMSHGPPEAGKGYELTPHNMDSPVHQLTMLAGIATLWGKAPA